MAHLRKFGLKSDGIYKCFKNMFSLTIANIIWKYDKINIITRRAEKITN